MARDMLTAPFCRMAGEANGRLAKGAPRTIVIELLFPFARLALFFLG